MLLPLLLLALAAPGASQAAGDAAADGGGDAAVHDKVERGAEVALQRTVSPPAAPASRPPLQGPSAPCDWNRAVSSSRTERRWLQGWLGAGEPRRRCGERWPRNDLVGVEGFISATPSVEGLGATPRDLDVETSAHPQA